MYLFDLLVRLNDAVAFLLQRLRPRKLKTIEHHSTSQCTNTKRKCLYRLTFHWPHLLTCGCLIRDLSYWFGFVGGHPTRLESLQLQWIPVACGCRGKVQMEEVIHLRFRAWRILPSTGSSTPSGKRSFNGSRENTRLQITRVWFLQLKLYFFFFCRMSFKHLKACNKSPSCFESPRFKALLQCKAERGTLTP